MYDICIHPIPLKKMKSKCKHKKDIHICGCQLKHFDICITCKITIITNFVIDYYGFRNNSNFLKNTNPPTGVAPVYKNGKG